MPSICRFSIKLPPFFLLKFMIDWRPVKGHVSFWESPAKKPGKIKCCNEMLFLFDFAYLVDAIYDAKPGATVPVDKYGGRIVNKTDSAFVAGFEAGVGVIHLDKFHPCAFGVHFPHPIHGMLVGEVIICHNFHRFPLCFLKIPPPILLLEWQEARYLPCFLLSVPADGRLSSCCCR